MHNIIPINVSFQLSFHDHRKKLYLRKDWDWPEMDMKILFGPMSMSFLLAEIFITQQLIGKKHIIVKILKALLIILYMTLCVTIPK
jgi:hypothetical protein